MASPTKSKTSLPTGIDDRTDRKSLHELEQGKNPGVGVGTRSVNSGTEEDDRELEALGYKPSFKREFSNLATVRARADYMFCDV